MIIYVDFLIPRIVIVLILTVFYGCSASKVEYVENNQIPIDDNFDILSVITVRKGIINMKNKSAKFQKNYLGNSSAIVYFVNKTEKYIPLSEIEKIKIEIYNDREVLLSHLEDYC